MKDTNSLRDEIRMQQEKLSQEPFSKKLEYFWDYYKIQVIITVLLACMFGSILHSVITKKETVLSIAFVNAFPNVGDEILKTDFENYLELNTKKQQVIIDSTYYLDEESTSPYAATYSQKFSTNAMAGKLDVVLADEINFDFYAKQGFFQDLSFLLSNEELARYQENLYYVDHPYDTDNKPVPIGIKIDKTNKITETACYPNTNAYLGIVADSKHTDNAFLYLNYLEE